jgi:hypothetical protein
VAFQEPGRQRPKTWPQLDDLASSAAALRVGAGAGDGEVGDATLVVLVDQEVLPEAVLGADACPSELVAWVHIHTVNDDDADVNAVARAVRR